MSNPTSHLNLAGRLIRLGAPLAVAFVFQVGLQVVDTVMAGRYGAGDLAAIALAGSLVTPLFVIAMGVTQAMTPIVAQLLGAGRDHEIAGQVVQGLLVGVLLAALLMVSVANASLLLPLLDVAPETVAIARNYMLALLWGYPGAVIFNLLRTSCEGLGVTRPTMYIAAAMLLVNIPANYTFIYGEFGAPELGGAGCGVASALVMTLQVPLMAAVALQSSLPARLLTKHGWRPRAEDMLTIVRLGLPIGFKIFGAVGMFALANLMLAPFGEIEVAASAISGNVTTLIFMIPAGLAAAATIVVGQAVGAGNSELARAAGSMAVRISAAGSVVAGVLLVLLREDVATLYTHTPELIAAVSPLLVTVALYQLIDCIQEPAVGALRGYKDTRAPMLLGLAGYWLLGLPTGVVLGYGLLGIEALTGAQGFWLGFVVAEAFVAATVNARRVWVSKRRLQPGLIRRSFPIDPAVLMPTRGLQPA